MPGMAGTRGLMVSGSVELCHVGIMLNRGFRGQMGMHQALVSAQLLESTRIVELFSKYQIYICTILYVYIHVHIYIYMNLDILYIYIVYVYHYYYHSSSSSSSYFYCNMGVCPNL